MRGTNSEISMSNDNQNVNNSPGKGLESLIPKKPVAGPGTGNSGTPQDAAAPLAPSPAYGGLGFSPLDPSRELETEPEPVFLHVATSEDYLPDARDMEIKVQSSDAEFSPEKISHAEPPDTLPILPVVPPSPFSVGLASEPLVSPLRENVPTHAIPSQSIPPTQPPIVAAPLPAAPSVPVPQVEKITQSVRSSEAPIHHRHPAAPREEDPHTPKPYEAVFHIEVDKIKPNPQQPRRDFNEEAIKELAASIREFGILQPLVVTKVEKEVPTGTEVEYYLIAGERRLMAAKYAGLERVPAVVRMVDADRERLELAIIENLQRENLNPVEMGRAFARLQDEFRMTQREIAARMGKSREAIANTMRLLDLPPFIRDAVEAGRISESHGRLLLSITDPIAQERLFNDLVNQRMTTRELKNRVDGVRRTKPADSGALVEPELKMIQERLSSEFGTPVKISGGEDGGKITISFYSKEELQHILEKLQRGEDL